MATNLFAFQPTSYTATFTAATSAPTPVQVLSPAGVPVFLGTQFRVINAGSVLVFLGYGPTAAIASANAATTSPTSFALPLLPGTDEILTFPQGSFFTGITSSGTAAIYLTAGEGN